MFSFSLTLPSPLHISQNPNNALKSLPHCNCVNVDLMEIGLVCFNPVA